MSLTVCPKGSTKIILSYQNTAGPFTTAGGTARLTKRIDQAIGVRVVSMNIRAPAGFTWTGGWSYGFFSDRLGSQLARNPFQLAANTNNNALVSTAMTSLLGVSGLGQSTGFADNQAPNMLNEDLNPYMQFPDPCPIETFDWSIQPLNGIWAFTATYTIEVILEFKHLCECQCQ